MPDKSLIGMELLAEVLETVCFTAPIEGTIPISAMLIGPPGTGKSKQLLAFNSPSIHVTNDITTSGLAEILTEDRQELIRFIVIPDFNMVVSHKASTSTLTIASLLSVMSEGTMRIDDGRRTKEMKHAPIGILSAMTRDIFEVNSKKFLQLGISRRFVPLFFTYSATTRHMVQAAIANGDVTLQQLIKRDLEIPLGPKLVSISQDFAADIKSCSMEMASNLSYIPKWERDSQSRWLIKPFHGSNPIEFTPHMILRTMAKGHALRAKRITVHDEDIQFLLKFVSFTNYALPVQL